VVRKVMPRDKLKARVRSALSASLRSVGVVWMMLLNVVASVWVCFVWMVCKSGA